MTPEERAEIERRHAADAYRSEWRGLVDLFESFQQAHADRRALLDALAMAEQQDWVTAQIIAGLEAER